ncbi:MAG: alpha/beta fold hydrolase [Mycobacteriaceae bacterium]|nr:alpha/beta fold hydrolase [Mycobacteriaceae bacterium]
MNAERVEVRIPSHGEQLAAYLYRPAPASGPMRACVVMAHGFSATRDDGLSDYAEAFCDAGFVVLVFDYRHFGASSGQPRQLLDIHRQQDDYRAAIAWARAAEGIDPDRIALWGSSFSGGHVLVVAAGDPRIAAVIAQAPYTDSLPVMRTMPVRNVVRAAIVAVVDRVGAMLGRPPLMIAAVGRPGSFAALTEPDVLAGFEFLRGPNSLWRNEFAARLMLEMPFFRPVRLASRLSMPVLFCVCDADTTTPASSSIRAAHDAPRGELRRYPYGHFEIYHDPQVKTDQVDFLRRVLGEQDQLRPPAVGRTS